MEYCAVTNFAVFGFGLVTVGEVLSADIVKALGPETLGSLIERGAVAPASEPPAAEETAPDDAAEAPAEETTATEAAAEKAAPDDEFIDVEAEEIADADVVGTAAEEAPRKARKRK